MTLFSATIAVVIGNLVIDAHRATVLRLERSGLDLAGSLATAAEPAISRADRSHLHRLVTEIFHASTLPLLHVVIEDAHGEVLATAGSIPIGMDGSVPASEKHAEGRPSPGPWPRVRSLPPGDPSHREIFQPVGSALAPRGWVRIGLSTHAAWAEVAPMAWSATGTACIGILAALAAAWVLDHKLKGMLRRLIEGTQDLAIGNRDVRIDLHTGDELEEFVENFNRLADALASRELALERSNATLRSILTAIPARIALLSRDQTILMLNREEGRVFDIDRNFKIGRPCHEALEQRRTPCTFCPMEEALERRRPASADVEVGGADGASRFLRYDLLPVLTRRGDPFALIEYVSDRTAERRLEVQTREYAGLLERRVDERTRELAEERRKLQSIVSAAGAGLLLLDEEGRVCWGNVTAQSWFDPLRSPGATLTLRDLGLRSESNGPVLLRVGNRQELDLICDEPGGTRRHFHVTTTPVSRLRGEPPRILAVLLDVTERRAMEARLAQASRLASIGELAGGVAHEVNNPIGVVLAKCHLLLEHVRRRGDAKLEAGLHVIRRNGERVERITRSLLSFSRSSDASREALDVNRIVRESAGFVEHRAGPAGVRVETRLASQPLLVSGTSPELQQVLVNLLTNAIDAMPRGGVVRLETRRIDATQRDPGQVAIAVRDQGEGIPSTIAERVFEPFFTTKEVGRGTGLGLSIVHGIVRAHGGEIRVAPEPKGGTCFTVFLPLLTSTLEETS